MTQPKMELLAVTIDCSDADRLANFYAKLSGGEVTYSNEEYGYAQATVGGSTVNFQKVHSFTPPQWPGQEHGQQFHLDFRVDDLAAAVAHAIELGAAKAIEQPGDDGYTVMTDPDGHPFCLCPPSEE
ncbi:MAG: VOC family protein [Propionibacteriaceae bacterium]|nr:VOC family protein [Propionibacteriaceae bacterium]